MGTTLAEKVWADHLVRQGSDGAPDLLYIDLMLMHEVTSPQAFEGLRLAGRKPRHVDQLIATEDHNTPTVDIDRPNPDKTSALQLSTLEKNCKEFGVRLHPLGDADQGIVHAFAPILGLTQPGMTIVCGDSHTSTHGAFGALAFGIGTSEVEHVMATQTLSLKPFKTMAINVNGKLPADATAKDIILAIIAKIGTGGGQGYVIEYRGEAIRNLTMDERMTVCNMSIEAGARAGMIAPDETTFEYLKGRPHAPEGELWDQAVAYWKTLKTDDDAVFDKVVDIEVSDERIIQRLSGRRVCSACGASYHTTAKPSVKPDVCDRCGGALIVRKDDEPATILERLKVYHELTEPLVDFYRERGKLVVVEGQEEVADTTRLLLEKLGVSL